MNRHLSQNILTNVLTLLNHIYRLDDDDDGDCVAKCGVSELSSTWRRLQQLTSQATDNSLLSSLAVQSLAILIRHGPQSDVTQSVIGDLVWLAVMVNVLCSIALCKFRSVFGWVTVSRQVNHVSSYQVNSAWPSLHG